MDDKHLMYFAYVSETKVNQLYSQLGDFLGETVELEKKVSKKQEGTVGLSNILSLLQASMTANREQQDRMLVKGNISTIRKLQLVIEQIENREVVRDLCEILAKDDMPSLDAFCYTFEGVFNVPKSLEGQSEVIDEPHLGRRRVRSPIVELSTRVKRYEIKLSCSLRFFGDMGGFADDKNDEWVFDPHSGNWPFFRGDISARFSGLIFLNGMKEKAIFGSPLYLVHHFQLDKPMSNGFELRF